MVEESSHQGTIGDGVIFGVLVVWYFHAESFYFLKIFFFLVIVSLKLGSVPRDGLGFVADVT